MSTIKITKENFEKEVLNSEKPVLLDFWAAWCGPCKMVGPTVEQVAEETAGFAKVGKINIDEEPELAQRFKIMSIPTLAVIKNGKLVESVVGARTKQILIDMLKK